MKKLIVLLVMGCVLTSSLYSEQILKKAGEVPDEFILQPVNIVEAGDKVMVSDEGIIKLIDNKYSVKEIGKKGMGPGEFTLLSDITFKKPYIYGIDTRKVQRFDMTGKLAGVFVLDRTSPFQIALANDDKIFLHFFNSEYLIYEYRWGSKTPLRHCLKAQKINFLEPRSFYNNFGVMAYDSDTDKLYFAFLLDNEVLEIDPSNLRPLNTIRIPYDPPSSVKIRRMNGGNTMLLSNALIYDLQAVNGTIYLLIRQQNISKILEISGNKIKRTFRFPGKLIKFFYSSSQKLFYAINEDDLKILMLKNSGEVAQ